MFLVREDQHHAATWSQWLSQIQGLAPVGAYCSAEAHECLEGGHNKSIYSQQHLFTVYAHPKPHIADFPEGHLFHGRVVQNRIEVCALYG